MVHLEKTPLRKILRAVVYQNTQKLTLSEIVEREQPDIALTGVFYNGGTWKPVCPVPWQLPWVWCCPPLY